MKNKKQKKNLYKTNSTSELEYSKIIKITISVILILAVTYFVTALITGEIDFSKKEEDVKEEVSIQYDEIIAGPGDKKEKCIKNNLNVMIEDKASNVIKISDHIPVLCFDAPYNAGIKKENVTRVYSWYQIYNYFLSIENKN